MTATPATVRGHGMQEAPGEHPVFIQHKHPNYVGIFFVLLVFTIIEVWITTPFFGLSFGAIFGNAVVIPALVLFAILKFATIAAFYMHLRFDSRAFTVLFAVGLFLALGMWLTLQGLFTAHSRVPFDEVAAREQGILAGGPGEAAGTPAAGAASTTGAAGSTTR